jgi:hypothetical protein
MKVEAYFINDFTGHFYVISMWLSSHTMKRKRQLVTHFYREIVGEASMLSFSLGTVQNEEEDVCMN